jgi:voltage-gated potassium channel Kch
MLYGLIYFSIAKTWSVISGISSSWDALYFSFVTITTLGYGDIQPAGFARVIATMEAVWGLLFGIALLGRFVAALPADRALDDSGT